MHKGKLLHEVGEQIWQPSNPAGSRSKRYDFKHVLCKPTRSWQPSQRATLIILF